MLDFPMVVILLHLGGQHLTTPYFETICLHFVSCLFTFSVVLLTSGPNSFLMDMIQGGNRMVFV